MAIDMLAEKKFPGDPRAAERIRGELTSGHGPATHGTTVWFYLYCQLDSQYSDSVCWGMPIGKIHREKQSDMTNLHDCII